jgi:hypothetical protein
MEESGSGRIWSLRSRVELLSTDILVSLTVESSTPLYSIL